MSTITGGGESRIILVTGANRGVGLAIVQNLATHPVVSQNAVFFLASRDLAAGEDAVAHLRSLGVAAPIHALALDVTSNRSIRAAVTQIEAEYGKLDVLVNNAGIGINPKEDDLSDFRDVWARTYDVNVVSVAVATTLFLPLLRKSGGGLVINVSSARASMTRSATGQLPPTASMAYSISKTALNALTLEFSKDPRNENVSFQLVSPGHCRTQLNNYRGLRDPLEGADVVAELVLAKEGSIKNAGFWETVGASRELVEIPW